MIRVVKQLCINSPSKIEGELIHSCLTTLIITIET